jgi:hypothetical protein
VASHGTTVPFSEYFTKGSYTMAWANIWLGEYRCGFRGPTLLDQEKASVVFSPPRQGLTSRSNTGTTMDART